MSRLEVRSFSLSLDGYGAERAMRRSPHARRWDRPCWQASAICSRRICGLTVSGASGPYCSEQSG